MLIDPPLADDVATSDDNDDADDVATSDDNDDADDVAGMDEVLEDDDPTEGPGGREGAHALKSSASTKVDERVFCIDSRGRKQ